MKYDPISKIMVEDGNKTKDSKTKDLERPYFDPLYKDTRRAIVKEVQNYLSSNGYNNSIGKYDKVVRGVRDLLEKTLLEPGSQKFNDAVHREADKLLKKYNLTKDSKSFIARDSKPFEVDKTIMHEKDANGKMLYLVKSGSFYVTTSDPTGHGGGIFDVNLKNAQETFKSSLLMTKLEKKYGKQEAYKRYLRGDVE